MDNDQIQIAVRNELNCREQEEQKRDYQGNKIICWMIIPALVLSLLCFVMLSSLNHFLASSFLTESGFMISIGIGSLWIVYLYVRMTVMLSQVK